MQYNRCHNCGADGGRCGYTIDGLCQNCHETKLTGEVHIYTCLARTSGEIERTCKIIGERESRNAILD